LNKQSKKAAKKAPTGFDPVIHMGEIYREVLNSSTQKKNNVIMGKGFYSTGKPSKSAFGSYLADVMQTNNTRPLRLLIPMGAAPGSGHMGHLTGLIVDIKSENDIELNLYNSMGFNNYTEEVVKQFINPITTQVPAIKFNKHLPESTAHQSGDLNCSHYVLNFFNEVANHDASETMDKISKQYDDTITNLKTTQPNFSNAWVVKHQQELTNLHQAKQQSMNKNKYSPNDPLTQTASKNNSNIKFTSQPMPDIEKHCNQLNDKPNYAYQLDYTESTRVVTVTDKKSNEKKGEFVVNENSCEAIGQNNCNVDTITAMLDVLKENGHDSILPIKLTNIDEGMCDILLVKMVENGFIPEANYFSEDTITFADYKDLLEKDNKFDTYRDIVDAIKDQDIKNQYNNLNPPKVNVGM